MLLEKCDDSNPCSPASPCPEHKQALAELMACFAEIAGAKPMAIEPTENGGIKATFKREVPS